MSAIFISHSSMDSELARELERWLAQRNHHSVFLDLDPEKGIVGGQSWERTLYRKLRACRAVIAICTDRYLASHWCFAEIALDVLDVGRFDERSADLVDGDAGARLAGDQLVHRAREPGVELLVPF